MLLQQPRFGFTLWLWKFSDFCSGHTVGVAGDDIMFHILVYITVVYYSHMWHWSKHTYYFANTSPWRTNSMSEIPRVLALGWKILTWEHRLGTLSPSSILHRFPNHLAMYWLHLTHEPLEKYPYGLARFPLSVYYIRYTTTVNEWYFINVYCILIYPEQHNTTWLISALFYCTG